MNERQLALAWWDYHAADFEGLPVDQPAAFPDGLEAGIARGRITPHRATAIYLADGLGPWLRAAPD